MMWFLKGIKKRIKTENLNDKYKIKYPSVLEGKSDYNCPTGAIENNKWVKEKCIFCEKCDLKPTYNQDMYNINNNIPDIFKKSFYLYPIDSGTCGACNTEFNTIFSPQYDINRFKIFLSNTPRHADALVIMGVYTENMDKVIENAYDAMPEPKLLIGLGACSVSGGIIGEKISKKFDIEILGCPPSPYTIINAILKARGNVK